MSVPSASGTRARAAAWLVAGAAVVMPPGLNLLAVAGLWILVAATSREFGMAGLLTVASLSAHMVVYAW